MAVVASATGAAVFGLSGVAAGLAGGALLGAGAGALYSGITGDGNILNSALTGGLLGATAGGIGAAFAPAAAGAGAGAGAAGAGATTPALTAAKGAGGTMGGISAGGAFTPSVGSSASFALPQLGLTGGQKLAAGLAGTTALSMIGGQNQPTIQEQESDAYIRPYTYSQVRNPRYGEPGQSYFTQSYEAGEPYKAARGGIMRMAEGGASSPAAAPVSSGVGIVPLAAPSSQYGPIVGSPEAQVAGLYRNVLGRAPDASGGKFWEDAVRSGAGIADIKNAFIASPENQAREAQRTQVANYNNLLAERANNEYNVQPAPLATLPGRGERAGSQDTSKIINQYYQNILGRQADPEGLAHWTQDKMTSGRPLADIRKDIASSPEAQARRQATTQTQQAALESSPEYQTYMSSAPSEATFDAQAYLAANPDAANPAIWQSTPYAHYLEAKRLGDERAFTRKPFQPSATSQPTTGQTGYTYNPVTKTYTAQNRAQANPAQDSSGIFGEMDPAVLQQMYNQYVQQQQQSAGGGKAGGLMPNALRYANGGEAIDSNPEKLRMISAINQRLQESPQMQDQRNQHEFMMRTDPNYRASMSPPLQGMIEGAQYGDRMMKSYGGQPRDFNVMPTTIDPSTRSYGGIASIGKQIDPKTRINAMANLYRSPYDKNAAEAVRRIGGGISRQIGKDANLAAYYEQDPMGRSKSGGVRYSQNFNQGGDIQGYNLGGYSDGGRLLKGPGDGVSDDIPATIGNRQPARLADGEFVIPARIVSELGNGSTDAGAKRLYAMMDKIQAGRKKTVGKGNVAKDTKAKKHLLA